MATLPEFRKELGRTEHYREQADYFATARYRSADDPVVAAYAVPKLNFVERVVPLAQMSVLDVGCGNGVFTQYLQKRCRSVTGVDFSERMLSENPCRSLVQADVASLPVRSGSYDVCFEANVLHHVDDPLRVVQEMSRVSRRWIVLVEPNRNNPVMFTFGLLVKAERKSLGSHEKALRGLLEACGLKVQLALSTGMISQNNTPGFLIPALRCFDRPFPFGEYVVTVAEKLAPRS